MVMFGLVMKHNKSEIFYFFRAYNKSNSELNFSAILRHIGDTWDFTLINACSSRNMFIITFTKVL